MALGDKAKEYAKGAKERVLSGQVKAQRVFNSSSSRPYVEYREDNEEEKAAKAKGAGIDIPLRNANRDLFDPTKQLQSAIKTTSPVIPAAPSFQQQMQNINTANERLTAPAKERQQRAKDSLLTDITRAGQKIINKVGGVVAEPLEKLFPAPKSGTIASSINERGPLIEQIGRASERAAIPGVTDNSVVPRFIRGVGDTASFGLSTYMDRMAGLGDRADGGTETTAGKVGQIAGGILLPAGKVKAGAGLVKNLVQAGYAGAMLSGLGEIGEEATNRNDQSYWQRLGDVGIGAGSGVAGGALGHAVSKGVQKILSKYNVPQKAAEKLLALPAPKERGNVNTAAADDVIAPEYTFGLPEARKVNKTSPLELPAGKQRGNTNTAATDDVITPEFTHALPDASEGTIAKVKNAAEARGDLKAIDDEIRQTKAAYDRAVTEEYKYLKGSGGQGKTKGGLIQDTDGKVTGRYGWQSKNPQWYQDFLKANNNRKPNNKELWNMAKDRVDNGFQDEQGFVPSWRAETQYDDQLAALEDVRKTIAESIRELDPAINLTDSPITSKELSFQPKTKIKTTVSSRPKAEPKAETAGSREVIDRYVKDAKAGKPIIGRASEPLTVPARANTSKAPKAEEPAPKATTAKRGPLKTKVKPEEAKAATASEAPKSPPKTSETDTPVIDKARASAEATPSETPLTRPHVDDATLVSGSARTKSSTTKEQTEELGFAQTVRTSSKTPPELRKLLEDTKLTGTRTSDQINAAMAKKMIDRDGAEAVADRLIAKKQPLSAVENTAAQVIARYYSDIGQMDKAVQIISKVAKSGRELGQAIQALSKWNKLDQEGAILLAERQLNRRTKDAEDWKSLTAEQAEKVKVPAAKLEKVESIHKLTKELVDMLTNRKQGAPFTEAEQDFLREYHKVIDEFDKNVRPILQKEKATREKTISDVQKIKPEERKKSQVMDMLSAQADKAREALKKQRNMNIVSSSTNPVILYSIIGAEKIAKGVVKFADWSDSMVKEGITKELPQTYVKSVNKFRKENGLPTNSELNAVINKALKDRGLDDETANSLRAMAAEIGFYADDAKLELTQDLQKVIKSIGRSTLGEKISTIQTAEMLLAVPTFLRNAIGGGTMILTEKFNKLAAVPIDWTVSKLTGERTIRFLPGSQEKFWKNYATGTKAGWNEVSTGTTLSSYDLQPNVFGDKNPLKYLSKTLGASLQGFDHAAYQQAYGDVLATYATNLGKTQGLTSKEIKEQMPDLIKQLDDKIYEMADEAGLYTTFQDDTLLSRASVATKRGLNAITDIPARNLRERGILPESISTEGFGLGDVVLKFAKTPANLVMRGIDYSPLGFTRSLIEIIPAVLGKGFNQRQFVLSMSRAITGTLGFTGLGFILARHGILTGAASQDKDMRSIQEKSGQGAYKVNFSALQRFISSGFDSDAAAPQEGDKMIDYAWMQPIAISLGMGVNAAEALDKAKKEGENPSIYKVGSTAVLGGLRSIFENPLLTGLKDVSDAVNKVIQNQDLSGFTQMITGVPASFIPTVVGQVRTGMDNTQREIFDKKFFGAVWNQVRNKLPGMSEKLPVSYDSLGKPRERIQGGESGSLSNYLTALLSPVKYTEYEVTPEARLALDVLKASDDSSVLPRIGTKYINVTDPETKLSKRVNLTNEQFSKLQQQMGQEVSERLLKKQAYLDDPNVSTDKKVKAVKKILTDAGDVAKKSMKKELGYKK